MRRVVPVLALLLAWTGFTPAAGLLIPEEKTLPPLAMLNHKVSITIDDQVAMTKVEQTFRNHTDRQLEATYLFPVPKGASVNRFTMLVDGKEVKGELVEAVKAREIYQSIVRRTQDPGLLEYMGNNLFRLRIFPVPAKGEQKVSLSYTAVVPRERDLVEYVYPLKTDGKAMATLEDFTITATIKSQHAVQNVYSATHAITLKRANDKEVEVRFEKNQGLLDKDFQMFYSLGDKDVGLTALTHRPVSDENGYALLLLTPRVDMAQEYQVPRDIVLVLDTSGSMRGVKMEQARKALKYCLKNLSAKDRFALINFATTVNRYKTGLLDVTTDQLEQAHKWVDNLDATGGTAINDALAAALDLRPKDDDGRTFTIVFFTDGQPTIGETNVDKILKNTLARNTGSTRIFTFGVGHDLNASMLDQLAEHTRAVSTYVRPEEDIEVKVAGLHSKISHPVLANLKLEVMGSDVSLTEIYPPQLPDLFHGGQLTVLGRYSGKGHAAVKLTGTIGREKKEFVYELSFADKTNDTRDFVEHLWARRKVGYLLDQIRLNGEKKELVEEVTTLAKKYGITTPYTSFLIVPDGGTPVAGRVAPGGNPTALMNNGQRMRLTEFANRMQDKPGDLAQNRGKWAEDDLRRAAGQTKGEEQKRLQEALDKKDSFDKANEYLKARQHSYAQTGKVGVDLSIDANCLRCQDRLTQTAQRLAYGRNCMEVGGVWIDDGFDPKKPTVQVKAMSDAYFRILEKQPKVKDVFQLGNHLVWVTPNGTNLVIDTHEGQEQLADAEIDKLFVAKK